jgi:hypothetical protein
MGRRPYLISDRLCRGIYCGQRSDCQGFQNPHGLRVGVAGVGVRVEFF